MGTLLLKMNRAFLVMKGVAFATYKEWAAYRSHMLVSLFIGPAYFLVQIAIWTAVFGEKETINGFTLKGMIAYYGVAALINYCIMDFADWNLQMLIRTGKFLTFLLRPVSHRYFALSQKVGHRILGIGLEGVPVYLLFLLIFKIKLIPMYPIWSMISILLSFLIMFLINYCIGMTAFWFVKADGIRRMFLLIRDISAGVFIPLVFFPQVIQKILIFLPFQYVVYVPIRVFLGSYEAAGQSMGIPEIVGMQALVCLAMWLFSEVLWRLGIKKFKGVGA